MKKHLYILLFLIIVASCSKNVEVLTKKETSIQFDSNEIDIVEDKIIKNNEKLIQFSLPNEQINIHLQNVPILKEYLQFSSDKETAIQNMKLIPIELQMYTIYLLEFSCYNNQCSYLVFDHNNEQPSHLVADLAEYGDYFLSPSQSKILFQFNRRNTRSLPSSSLIVIDLNNWEINPLKSNSVKQNLPNYKYPISSVAWIDENTISVMTPTLNNIKNTNMLTFENLNIEPTEIIFHIGQ